MKQNFYDSVEALVRSGKVKHSTDIKKMLEENKINRGQIGQLLTRMLNRDFGKITGERALRFSNHLDLADKDIYGVYDNVVLYYDASRDQLTVLTRDEFTTYYPIDWTESDRHGFAERYEPARRQIGKSMPTDPEKIEGWKESMLKEQRVLTEGQQRETAIRAREEAEKLAGGADNIRDFRNFLRYEWKVWPEEDYTEFVKHFDEKLGRDKRMNLVNLAKEYGIPVKRIYAIIMYYYQVQRKPLEAGYDYIMKNLGDKRKAGMFASDSRKE